MKRVINTKNAPAPIGPYNQAIMVKDTLYVSGQIALDAATGELLDSTIEEETTQVMRNLKAVLNAADLDFENIVKTSIFLSDMSLFAKVNEVYGKYFVDNFPARETVAVKTLPKNVNVEISAIAVKF
ncbi:RidA family protein [Pedobacter alpinus]|uniref:RidA family protein n=1 Tax=Pedobacter alpinus TaxID=1590643 RepID=A0ABW5TLQ5_9SPHI